MTSFAGIVTFDGAPLGKQIEQAVTAAAAGARRQRVVAVRSTDGIVAQRVANASADPRRTTGPFGRGRFIPGGSANDRILFAADVRLDNRAELLAMLGAQETLDARADDPGLILSMIDRFADAGIARCLGAFAFALWQPERRRLLLGRDCLGNRGLFYHRGDGFVAFASTLGGLLAMPRVPRQLDEIALANFLAVNLTAREQTFYRGIARVPSRSVIELGPRQTVERRYWSPNLGAATPARRDDDYIEEARERFAQAVKTATDDLPRLAISCSGGLDSSAIAATLAQLGRHSIACFTAVPPPGSHIDVGDRRYFDETDKVKALARLHPAINLHLMSSEAPHPYETDPARLFARAHMPILGPTVLGAHGELYDAVAASYPALIGGNAGNLCLTWDGHFSMRALLRGGRWATFAHELSAIARRTGRGRARTLFAEIALPGSPLWARRALHRMRGRGPDDVGRYSALNPAFIDETGLSRQWHEQAFEAWPLPAGWSAARHRARHLFDLNQMARDFKASSGDIFGYEIRDPFADRRLIEFALNVPEHLYRRDGVPRAFARAVFADRLPPEILNEQRRGMSAPTWFRRLDIRRQDIEAEIERLEASATARRLIDIPRIKTLLKQWPVDENAAQQQRNVYRGALVRGLHIGRFVRWVESANA